MALITIKDFQKGTGESPFLGYGEIRNIELDTQKGVARINMKTALKSGTTVTQLPLWIIGNRGTSGEYWALGDAQAVYKSSDSGDTWSLVTGNDSGSGQGMIVWKQYLLVFRASTIDVYGKLGSSPSWTTSWQTIDSDLNWHPSLTGQDDIVYGGAGRYIFSIQEVSGQTFNPSNSATYTYTQQALDLPSDHKVRCLAELGSNLMIGTWVGSNIYDFKIATIFPWDRVSDSFNLPIQMSENGIQAMKTIGNLIYFFAGIEGKCFVTDGSSVRELFRIPQSIVDLAGGAFIEVYPGSVDVHRGKLVFGLKGAGNNSQMWSYDLETKALAVEYTISTANTMSVVGAINSVTRDTLLAGWRDGSSDEGIDKVVNSARYASYAAYIRTPYYLIGSKSKPQPVSEIEFKLANALATGEGVRLKYRTDVTSSFTTIATFDFSTNGAILGGTHTVGVTVDEGIQFEIALTTSSDGTPELVEVEVR